MNKLLFFLLFFCISPVYAQKAVFLIWEKKLLELSMADFECEVLKLRKYEEVPIAHFIRFEDSCFKLISLDITGYCRRDTNLMGPFWLYGNPNSGLNNCLSFGKVSHKEANVPAHLISMIRKVVACKGKLFLEAIRV